MQLVKSLLFVGVGGAGGSIFRYLISIYINKNHSSIFPWHTFIANCLGCFLVGIIFELFEKHLLADANLKLLLITGFCGGITTFSTFSAEGYSLIQAGNYTTAIIYIACSIMAGLGLLFLGITAVKLISA